MTRRLVLAAFVVAVLGAAVAAFAPLGRSCGVSMPGGQAGCVGQSIFETDGSWVLVVVSVPVLISLLPMMVPRRAARVVAAVLLWACCVIGIFSVGMFFVPAAVVMTVAAVARDQQSVPASG